MKILHGECIARGLTPEYEAWRGLRKRCRPGAEKRYPRYAGRGITVCSGWSTFEAFLADMGRRPSASHSIDRIRNADGYWCGHCEECRSLGREPNCRWATPAEQNNNTRTTRFVTANGETLSVRDWGTRLGLSANTIRVRLLKGWDPVEAVTTPKGART